MNSNPDSCCLNICCDAEFRLNVIVYTTHTKVYFFLDSSDIFDHDLFWTGRYWWMQIWQTCALWWQSKQFSIYWHFLWKNESSSLYFYWKLSSCRVLHRLCFSTFWIQDGLLNQLNKTSRISEHQFVGCVVKNYQTLYATYSS